MIGILEHVPATAPNIFLRTSTVTAYTHPTANTWISDVRPVVENGAIRYLIIAYLGATGGPLAVSSAQFRVWGPPSNNPAPTTLACGTNSIAGCKTCGSGTGALVDSNKCEVCADGQGNYFSLKTQG